MTFSAVARLVNFRAESVRSSVSKQPRLPRRITGDGTLAEILVRLFRAPKFWLLAGVVAVVVVVVPQVAKVAKVPVALGLGVPLVVRLLDHKQAAATANALTAGARSELDRYLQRVPRRTWPPTHHVATGPLRLAGRRSSPRLVLAPTCARSRRAASGEAFLTQERTSEPQDRNLKPGRMQIMEYRLTVGPPLLLAVSNSLADALRHALTDLDNQ